MQNLGTPPPPNLGKSENSETCVRSVVFRVFRFCGPLGLLTAQSADASNTVPSFGLFRISNCHNPPAALQRHVPDGRARCDSGKTESPWMTSLGVSPKGCFAFRPFSTPRGGCGHGGWRLPSDIGVFGNKLKVTSRSHEALPSRSLAVSFGWGRPQIRTLNSNGLF